MLAPFAVNVAEPPTQIAVEEAAALTVILGVTDKLIVRVLVHPEALVPIKVYVVLTNGETTALEAAMAPGYQV